MKFSIIVAYYQGVNDERTVNRLLKSLQLQTDKDFEVIMVHDGALLEDIKYDDRLLDIKYYVTSKRENIWGHNCRNFGITKASGEYLLFTNGDNVYNIRAIEKLNNEVTPEYKMYSMPLTMIGMVLLEVNGQYFRHYPEVRKETDSVVLNGKTIRMGQFDLMQVITHKSLWTKGWYNYTEASDGIIFPELHKRNTCKHIDYNIGKHY